MPASKSTLPEPGVIRTECVIGSMLLLAGSCSMAILVGTAPAMAFAAGGILLGGIQWFARRRIEVRARSVLSESTERMESERRTLLETTQELRARVGELEGEAREMRREQERIERAASGKGSFLANMSHEIRTPMSGILGMVELLLGTELSAEQRDMGHTIQASSRQVLAILGDILDYSKLEAGKMELEANEFDVRRQAQDAVEMLASQATAKGLELSCLVDAEVPERVVGDETRLVQLLVNLLGNAVKFTHEGTVTLHVSSPGVQEGTDVTEEPCRLTFAVKDTGVGIPADRQQALFLPFTQLEASTSRTHGGTGLGLAISRQLAETMGGELQVESVEGEGSTFRFEVGLQVADVGTEDDGAASLCHGSLEGQRALVIDANSTARHAVVTYASSFGLRVDEADDHEVALRMLHAAHQEGTPYAFAFIDSDLPRIDGRELASRIKGEAPLEETRLVLCNTIDRMDKPAGLVRAGFDAWVTKPIGREKLRTVLQHLLEDEEESCCEGCATNGDARSAAGFEGLNVLLVEDNVVNQKVASLLLRRLGCEVVLARNGRQAVDLAQAQPFDVVLMDSKMPIMDGFAATAAIRALDDPRTAEVPIIAMTASAMRGDRERCLAAGMNDYLPKPVQGEALHSMLQRWSVGQRETQSDPQSNDGEPAMTHGHDSGGDGSILDPEVVDSLRALGESTGSDLFAELVGLFLEDTPARLAALTTAFEAGDLDTVEAEAHALKSSCANLGALTLSSVFQGIEQAGRERDAQRAADLMERTQGEFARVEEALKLEVG